MPNGRFDHAYMQDLTVGTWRGVNAHSLAFPTTLKGIDRYPERTWFVTLIAWRFHWRYAWGWLMQQLFHHPTRNLESAQAHSNVAGVGLWCLKEGQMSSGEWQAWHGLFDRNGRLTRQGRMVKRFLSRS